MSRTHDEARARVAALERKVQTLDDLRQLHDGIADSAEHVVGATVAVLTLLPYVSNESHAVELLGDVMDLLGKAVSQLVAAQAAGMRLVERETAEADELTELHSVKV